MSSARQTLTRRVVQGAVSLAKTGERWMRPATRANPLTARSILVLEYMLPLGNLVHMTPVFEALKHGREGITITVATRGLGLGVLRHSPFVDHLIETPDPLTDLDGAVKSLKLQLRERGITPDCCLTGVADQRTKIALLAVRACSGWRGGYTILSPLYHHPLTNDRSRSLIANNLRVAWLVGARSDLLEPRLFYTQADVMHARTLLDPLRSEDRPVLVVVSQNSGGQRTGWHEGRWVSVLRHAHDVLGYALAFVGTAKETDRIDGLREKAGSLDNPLGISLAGRTSVNELAALLAMSDMVISLDTGTMHVGRAVGVPMVVLGPSWQKPTEWLPLGKPNAAILRGEDREGVPEGYLLDEIEADAAIAALDRLTTVYPASEAARQERVVAGLSNVDLMKR